MKILPRLRHIWFNYDLISWGFTASKYCMTGWMKNLKWREGKRSWLTSNLRYYTYIRICPEGLKTTTKNLRPVLLSLIHDLNLHPREKSPRNLMDKEDVWAPETVWTLWNREKSFSPPGNRTPAVQSTAIPSEISRLCMYVFSSVLLLQNS
jgi:hypothetical protein